MTPTRTVFLTKRPDPIVFFIFCQFSFLILLTTLPLLFFFFFNDTATTEIYTLSLHDALPIWINLYYVVTARNARGDLINAGQTLGRNDAIRLYTANNGWFLQAEDKLGTIEEGDRKSTRLNSSHQIISYAVFCLKKKKNHARSSHSHGGDPPQRSTKSERKWQRSSKKSSGFLPMEITSMAIVNMALSTSRQ